MVRNARLAVLAVFPVLAASLLLSSAAAVAKVPGPGPAKKTKAVPTYTIDFTISTGNYASHRDLDGYKQSEIDNFEGYATYDMIKIPAKGKVGPIRRVAAKFAMKADKKGDPAWEAYGSDWQCTGKLTNDDEQIPPPLLKAQSKGGNLDLALQLGAGVLAEDITGTIGDNTPCTNLFPDGTPAFYPARLKYMPKMVTADFGMLLATLRKLKVGGSKTIKVNAHNDAADLPPEDCSVGTASCNQRLSWQGTVLFTRES